MSNSALGKSSIGKKILMALSGFFLLVFLFQHALINFLSVISPETFNEVAHFMGNNPMIQFAMQPVLAFGVVFHLAMGLALEIKNKKARPIKYAYNNPKTNSSWISRNMVITGIMILAFFVLHFIDFWFPELKMKFVDGEFGNPSERYYEDVVHSFQSHWRTIAYTVAFIFLSLHLMHGFQSAFQSVGFRHNKYTPTIKKLGTLYAIVIPAVFIFIAWYHHLIS